MGEPLRSESVEWNETTVNVVVFVKPGKWTWNEATTIPMLSQRSQAHKRSGTAPQSLLWWLIKFLPYPASSWLSSGFIQETGVAVHAAL
jgi:hypothetical protein